MGHTHDPERARIREQREIYSRGWSASYEYLEHEHEKRKWRIYNRVTHHGRRQFAAISWPYTSGKGVSDIQDLRSI